MNIVYIRTSTSEQKPELQIKDIESMTQGQEYLLFREMDSAWAENVKRPELDKVIDLIKKGKVKNLYVWHLDRIYRNQKKLHEFLVLCKTYDVTLLSYNQKWLEDFVKIPPPFNTMMRDLMITIIGWNAEEDSKTRSARVKMAVVRKVSGTFSHKGNKWGKIGFPTQTVNRVLQLADEGMSTRQIAKQVKVYDKNRNERNISKSAVHKIIVKFSSEEAR